MCFKRASYIIHCSYTSLSIYLFDLMEVESGEKKMTNLSWLGSVCDDEVDDDDEK